MIQRVAIMQPYLLPYIGYFQLIAAVDSFVIYDNIKYTKKGWINRNRLQLAGQPWTFTVPLKADADNLYVVQRQVADSNNPHALLRRIEAAYHRAPYFAQTMALAQQVLLHPQKNLFDFLLNSLHLTLAHLEILTSLTVASMLSVDSRLKGQDRVIATCQALNGTRYINPVGGIDLYDGAVFAEHGLELFFLRSRLTPYPQGSHPFVSALSILDVLFFNGASKTRSLLASDYDIFQVQPYLERCHA